MAGQQSSRPGPQGLAILFPAGSRGDGDKERSHVPCRPLAWRQDPACQRHASFHGLRCLGVGLLVPVLPGQGAMHDQTRCRSEAAGIGTTASTCLIIGALCSTYIWHCTCSPSYPTIDRRAMATSNGANGLESNVPPGCAAPQAPCPGRNPAGKLCRASAPARALAQEAEGHEQL